MGGVLQLGEERRYHEAGGREGVCHGDRIGQGEETQGVSEGGKGREIGGRKQVSEGRKERDGR